MGLNEQFAHVCGQILLMYPLPSVNKALALVLQDEKQRQVGSSQSQNSESQLAFAVKAATSKNRQVKKDRPQCSHCGILGHIADKCYKLHGYPPGYKFKSKSSASSSNVNQVSITEPINSTDLSMMNSQYQQLLALLATQLSQATKPIVEHIESSCAIPLGGTQQLEDDWQG